VVDRCDYRSALVDRAVQSELTTCKTVAENCLALTADVVNSADDDQPTSNIIITQRADVVETTNHDNTVVEEFQSVAVTQRRDSYLQAIMYADNVDVEGDLDIAASAAFAVAYRYSPDGSTCSSERP